MTLLNSEKEVTDALIQAVTARFPENRYWVGVDANWHFNFVRHLPPEIHIWHERFARYRLNDGYGVPPSICVSCEVDVNANVTNDHIVPINEIPTANLPTSADALVVEVV